MILFDRVRIQINAGEYSFYAVVPNYVRSFA